MDLKSYFSDKLDKFVFLQIKGEEAYLPVRSSSIIQEIKEEGDLDKIPLGHFLYGMFFMLGADEKFIYRKDYLRIIRKTEGSIKYIKGKIAEEIKNGNYEEGYILLKGLSAIEKSQDVFSKLIMLLETLGEKDPAFKEEELEILEKAKEIEGYSDAYYHDALLKKESKDYQGALESINKFIELSGSTENEIIELRNSLVKSANYEKAKELVFEDPQKALTLLIPLKDEFQDDAVLLYYTGVCYRMLGNHEKSIYYLEQALDLDKDLIQVVNELGINYASLGDYETAVSYLRKAFEATRSVEICTNLVMCYLNMGRLEDAKTHLQIAEKLNPGDEVVLELKKLMSQY